MTDTKRRLQFNRDLLTASDLPSLCADAVSTIAAHLNVVSAALFLFSKRGTLLRVASAGVRPDLSDEEYTRGDDTVDLCAIPDGDETYGRLIVLTAPFLGTSDTFRHAYRAALANATEIAYLPLNGPNRSYGVIRIIAAQPVNQTAAFTDNDLADLEVFAHQVAISISSLRRTLEQDVIAKVNKLLTADPTNVDPAYDHVASALVGPWTEYAACSIRIRGRHGDFKLASLSSTAGVTSNNKDRLARPPDTRLISAALATGEPVIINDVQANLDLFHDPAWLAANGFRTAAVFPIRSESENLGTLAVYIWYPYTFYETKRRFLKQVCSQLGTATAVVSLLTARDRLIQRMSDIMSQSNSRTALVQTILDSACDLTGASQGYIALRTNRDPHLHPLVYAGGLADEHVPMIDIGGLGLTALAARTAQTVWSNDVEADTSLSSIYVDFTGKAANKTRSELVVPLSHEGRVLGVIAVQSDHHDCFNTQDVLLLETLARYATFVFQRDRLLDATTRLANIEFSRRDRKKVLETIAKSAADLLDADAALVLLVDPQADHLYIESHYPENINLHLADTVLPRDTGMCWDSLRLRDVVVFGEIGTDPRFYNRPFAQANGFTEMVSVPLYVREPTTDTVRELGVINLFLRTAVPFLDVERQVLRILGSAASFALYDLDMIEETTRSHALATITARTTAAIEVSARLAREAMTPLRLARQAASVLWQSVSPTVLERERHRLTGALSALTSLLSKIAPRETALTETPALASEVLTDAFRLLNTRIFASDTLPSLSIGETELWRRLTTALHRLNDLLRLRSAVLYISHHRDYREFKRVVVTSPQHCKLDRLGLPSFEEFSWLTLQTYTVLPHVDGRLAWVDVDKMVDAPQAVLFGHEVTGGRLIILGFGLQASRTLDFSEVATLYEAVTAQLYPYIDNAMFGIELDFLTSETGHLLGRAIGKVQSGIRTLLEFGTPSAAASSEDIHIHQLAQHSVEDGLIRLDLIRNNFYWFSAQRRHYEGGTSDSPNDFAQALIRTFDVVRLLHDMRPMFTREAGGRGLKPTHFDLRATEATVRGPESLLRLAFLNLYDNALKFAYANTFIEISLRIDDGRCTVIINNLGVGVAPDEWNAVFERLRRSRYQDTSRRIDGLGLGLPYCSRVVTEIFHGTIALQSHAVEKPGVRRFEGDNWLTTVTVTLPLARG